MPARQKQAVFFLLTFGVFVFLSLNWHSHRPKFNFQSEIWGDRAGYHVFLPAAFDYHFDADLFPKGIADRTGNGFQLDSIPGKVVTKYTCGEALLRTPFYLLGMVFRDKDDPGGAGFTIIDHAMVNVAASFYCTLGLWLLYAVLRRRFPPRPVGWGLLAMLVGTNLLFYTIGDSGMTHVYSFFLFAIWTSRIDRGLDDGLTPWGAVAMGLIAGLVVLVRPTNIVFLPVPFLLLGASWITLQRFFTGLLRPANTALVLMGSTIVFLPQLAYWNYTFGSPVVWSYGNEGFPHLLAPRFIPFWFSPYNGLFVYAPLLLVILVGALIGVKQAGIRIASWTAFLLVSYLCSAWFAWTFGCSFGSRNFVEYSAVFAFPLVALLNADGRYKSVVRALIALCCLYTLKLTLSCSNCWFGGIWDWSMYFDLLLGPLKI